MKARPTKAQLHRFRVNHGLGDEGAPALGSADPLPPSRLAALNFTTDPVDVLRFINATLHLKDLRHTSRVFTNIAKAMWPDQAYAMLLHAQSDGLHIPCRRLLIEGRARLDVACMLLDRRLLSGHQFLGYHERSTHIYCDSSPITGRELFCVSLTFTWLLVVAISGNSRLHRWASGIARWRTGALQFFGLCGSWLALAWMLWKHCSKPCGPLLRIRAVRRAFHKCKTFCHGLRLHWA